MTDNERIAEIVARLNEEADSLNDAVDAHLVANADWIRDNGKRSVTIVEYQLNKNDLGYEERLARDAATLIADLTQENARLTAQVDAMRELLRDYGLDDFEESENLQIPVRKARAVIGGK